MGARTVENYPPMKKKAKKAVRDDQKRVRESKKGLKEAEEAVYGQGENGRRLIAWSKPLIIQARYGANC